MPLDIFDDTPQASNSGKKVNWWLILSIGLAAFLLWSKFAPTVGPPNVNPSGLHVLIVEERDARRSLPAEKLASYLSTDVSDELAKGKYRIIDQDDDVSKDDKVWADLKALPRASVPWIYLSNPPKAVISKPLVSVEDTLALIKKAQ